MELNSEFYEPILAGLSIKDLTGDGRLSTTFNPEKPSPVTVNGKRLCLPIKDILRAGKKDDQIIFHPLSENVTRGESETIKALRDYIQWRNQTVVVLLATELGRVAATPSEHKNYPAKAKKYLQQLSDFDERTYTHLLKLLKAVKPDPDRRIISITLRQGSKSKEDGTMRSCQVHFPIFEDFEKDDLEIFEVKMPSKKAKQRIAKLFEIILGDEEVRQSYSYGSRNMDAPYLHALLTTHSLLAKRLNDIVHTHEKLLGEELAAQLTTNLDWLPGLEEFAILRNMVPPQSGNEGAIKVADLANKARKELSRDVLAPPTDREPEAQAPWEGESEFDNDKPERILRDDRSSDRRPAERTRETPRDNGVKKVSLSDFMAKGEEREERRPIFSRDRGGRDDRRPSGGRGGLGGGSRRRSF